MNDILTAISNYGVSIVIIGLFIWDWITNKKTNSETLKQIAESNKNIAKSLDIIQNNQLTLEQKVDRNYDALKEKR
jgi:hypothetical protein